MNRSANLKQGRMSPAIDGHLSGQTAFHERCLDLLRPFLADKELADPAIQLPLTGIASQLDP